MDWLWNSPHQFISILLEMTSIKIMKNYILTFNFRRNQVIPDFRNRDINTKLFGDFAICMLNPHLADHISTYKW